MSTSSISLFAVGQDPRLEKILERAKKIEEQVKYLESKAIHLQIIDRVGSDDFFEEFEVAIEVLLKDLVLDLWNAKSSTLDKLSWSWSPPDYVADHRDFLGRLYCTLKLTEQIHEENSQMENIPLELSPPPLGQLSPQDNGCLKTPCTDTKTLSTELSRQHQQDDRHQKATLLISKDLTEFSEIFNYYHSRLKKYIQELRRHQKKHQDLSNITSLTSRKPVEQLQPLPSSRFKGPRRQESSTRREHSSRSQQGEAVLNAKQREEGSKRKRAIVEERFEKGLRELSETKNEDTRQKRKKASEERVSDTLTEPWDFDPDREEYTELKDIRDRCFTQLVLMQDNSDTSRKVVLGFTNYDIEIKRKA